MAKFKTLITTVGAAKIAAVLAGTGSIVLDSNARMAVGDGGGSLPTPVPSQTKLVKEVYRAALNTASIDARDPKNIIAELIIPPDQGGFWMREMALYDAAGTLLAVGNMAETYKPSLSEGAGRKQVIRMVIAVSDVAAVTITMDTATVMATQEYVDDKLDAHEKSRKHPDATLTEKGFTQLNSATDSALETQAATPKAVKIVMDATNLKAPLDSPQLTGAPKAPTAPAGTNTTQLANTAFVMGAIAALVNSSPGVLDTLGELAAALGNDANFSTTVMNLLAGKQPKDTTLTNLSGKNIAELLQFLGLTNFADKKSTVPQIFDTAVVSNDSIVAQSGAAKVVLSAQNGLKLLTYQSGQYTGGIEIPKESGEFALKSDIAALVNASPAALDTLKELADALGNDANFSTTVMNALAGKQQKDTTLTNLSGKDVAGLITYLGLKSAALRDVGTGANQIPDMSNFLSSVSASAGYQQLPGGLTLQFGTSAIPTGGSSTITLPKAAQSRIILSMVTFNGSQGTTPDSVWISATTPTTITLNHYGDNGAITGTWIVLSN